MLEALNLHRYRRFESYQMGDLARVNLVVGKNNCGKTSILEAIELLVSGGRVSALRESAVRRGELDENVGYGVDISHVFHGHHCTPGAAFELSSLGTLRRLERKILALDDIGDATVDRWLEMAKRRRRFDSGDEPPTAFGLSLIPDGQQPIVLPTTENGSLSDRPGVRTPSNQIPGRVARFLRELLT